MAAADGPPLVIKFTKEEVPGWLSRSGGWYFVYPDGNVWIELAKDQWRRIPHAYGIEVGSNESVTHHTHDWRTHHHSGQRSHDRSAQSSHDRTAQSSSVGARPANESGSASSEATQYLTPWGSAPPPIRRDDARKPEGKGKRVSFAGEDVGSQLAQYVQSATPLEVAPEVLFDMGSIPNSNFHPMCYEDVRESWDLDYFRNFENASRMLEARKYHNHVLKSTRDKAEDMFGPSQCISVPLPNDKPYPYAEIEHFPNVGQNVGNYKCDYSKLFPWSWREMVSAFQDDDASRDRNEKEIKIRKTCLEIVVTGPEGRARGIMEVRIENDPDSYDHHRHSRARLGNEANKMCVWNFVVFRDDGTCCRLHPDHNTNKCRFDEDRGVKVRTEPPVNGLGRSDGPGTYRKYKDGPWTTKLYLRSLVKPKHR